MPYQTNNKTILIIDDEEPMRHILRDRFSKEGYQVTEAKNGKEGLDAAFSLHPDLILLDVLMPKMDGMTTIKKLREDSWGKQVKVIILSNVTLDDKKIQEINETQPSYFLTKSNETLDAIFEKGQALFQESNEHPVE